MKNIIYRNHAVTTFASAFMSEAMAYSTKLTFTTRDEYLNWVKEWKEDYKAIEHKRKLDVLCARRDGCTLETKKDYYQKRLDKLPDLTPEQKDRCKAVSDRIAKEMGFSSWLTGDTYWTIIALLIIRKAGKIRAHSQRNARLLEQKQAV